MITAKVDHLILGVNNLERGIKDFQERTGIRPQSGGEHPAFGTHNELVSLGEGMYLEVIAPQLDIPPIQSPFGGLEQYHKLTIIGWAIRMDNLKQLVLDLDEFGLMHSGIQQGHRKTRHGRIIEWETVFIQRENRMSIDPFFISWEDSSIHPSRSTPEGCALLDVQVIPLGVKLLDELISSIPLIRQSNSDFNTKQNLFQFNLETPKGPITFE